MTAKQDSDISTPKEISQFEAPKSKHGGLRGKPAPDVGVGIRVRGKAKKLTGYIALRKSVLERFMSQEQIEDGAYCQLLLGKGEEHRHIIRVMPARPRKTVGDGPVANGRFREQKGGVFILETALIPVPEGMGVTRRTAAQHFVNETEGHITVFFLTGEKKERPKELLPWEDDPDQSSSGDSSPDML